MDKEKWTNPEVDDLGDARDLIQNVSVSGSGDSQVSILDGS